MITIVNRAFGEEFVSFFHANGTSAIFAALGEGTVAREILDMWGLESTQKEVLFSVVTEDGKKRIFKELKRVMRIDVPGNGISMTLSLKSITKLGAINLVPDFNETEKSADKKEGDMADTTEIKANEKLFELIIAIADSDRIDEVMAAAREAGARGGTRLKAKGTAPEEVKKFFGVNISEEKELLFIVAPTEQRATLMKAISATNTEGKSKAVSFSLPIDTVEGLYRE